MQDPTNGNIRADVYNLLHQCFYKELIPYLQSLHNVDNMTDYLNAVEVTNYDKLLTRSVFSLSRALHGLCDGICPSAVSEAEIYAFLDGGLAELWECLRVYGSYHHQMVEYHNQHWNRSQELINRGAYGGIIGGALGSVFGPIGTTVGSVLGGMFAGNTVETEYQQKARWFQSVHSAFLNEIDAAWALVINVLYLPVLDEVAARGNATTGANARAIAANPGRRF